ncbi:MAG: YcaQ family DNA glycosylase [Microthrixaceae bacterium]|nr:YcaQ family DNA glycosylase [Microthrixaceae bacterium]
MARPDSLRADQARRLHLAAQGFAAPRPPGRVDRRHVRRVFDRLGLIQIDSVNVLVRSHYLPLFSRLGPYDRGLLDRFAYRDHEAFEYWGHEASLIRSDLHPLLRWRMAREHQWSGMREWGREHGDLVETVLGDVLARGPISAGELDEAERKKGPWWGWGDTKRALEHLFYEGRVGALRRPSFERVYCDPRLVVPAEVYDRPTPDERDALVALLERSARTRRASPATCRPLPAAHHRGAPLLEEMASAGVIAVAVEGWTQPALSTWTPRCRGGGRRAPVSPFDLVMWSATGSRCSASAYASRSRAQARGSTAPRPALLLGDCYVARVDLKADCRLPPARPGGTPRRASTTRRWRPLWLVSWLPRAGSARRRRGRDRGDRLAALRWRRQGAARGGHG